MSRDALEIPLFLRRQQRPREQARTMNQAEKIRRTAEHLDLCGKPTAQIRTKSPRRYLLRLGMSPSVRGGPLFVGQHEVVTRARSLRAPQELELL